MTTIEADMMRTLRRFAQQLLCCGFVLGLMGALPAPAQESGSRCPPATRIEDVKDEIAGVEVTDPYRWLEDQGSPETRAWIDAQERCTEAALRNLAGRAEIEHRLTTLMKVDSIQVPIVRNGRYFYLRRGADQDLNVLYMRRGLQGPDEVLVDPHPLSTDHSTSVTLDAVSRDGKLVFYGLRAGGEDESTVHIIDAQTHKDLPDHLPRATYFSISPKPDDTGFFYSRMTKEGPRLHYHQMGSDPARDAEIFGKELGPEKILLTDLSEDGHYLLITVLSGSGVTQDDLYFQDVKEGGPIAPIVKDVQALFAGAIAGNTLYLSTNWNAPFWRILSVDLKNPGREHWREIVPTTDAKIEDVGVASGKLVVNYTRNATSQLKIFDTDGRPGGEVSLPNAGTISGLSWLPTNNEVFFSFRSFNVAPTVYRCDVTKALATVWTEPAVPIRSADFEVKQVWFKSKDGTQVPMFLFYKKGLKLNGSNPTVLTGYGGFDVSETPWFRAPAVLWVERGGVYAVPNLRGGGEFGETWHHAGMLEKKQNVFDDFVGAADWLIRSGYTNSSKLAILGQSNGGLLVGAALTQRPDLFRAVVCQYPLLDMIRYQKFLVAQWWVPEYGSSDDPAQLPYLYAYSPYHHVQRGIAYPAVLFVTGDGDTRVAPLHARKMAARLQAAANSGRPILLLYDTKSGHSGGRPVSKEIEEQTDLTSFLFWQLDAGPGTVQPQSGAAAPRRGQDLTGVSSRPQPN